MLNAIRKADKKDLAALLLCVIVLVYGLVLSLIVKYRTPDEALYLQETMLISELFKRGQWIGNYGVGVHGFLFKLPPALIFLITGPSIIVATTFHVILASLSCWIFYKIQKDLLKFGWWSVLGCFFLITTQTFIFVFPTYLREIPSLFSLLLFFYFFLKYDKRYWILGLILVLILDSKEYAYFNLLAAFFIWSVIEVARQNKKEIIFNIIKQLKMGTKVLLPSFIYVFLMLYTSVIPLNPFIPFILGATEKNNFIQYATKYTTRGIAVPKKTVVLAAKSPPVKKHWYDKPKIKAFRTLIRNYIKTIIDPKSFGLTSIPFYATIPAIFTSFIIFKKNYKLFLLSLYQNVFLLTYLSQFNQSRYLFPTYMTLIIFFIYYLMSNTSKKLVLLLTSLTIYFTVLQLKIETILVLQKIIFYTLLISTLLLYKILNNRIFKTVALCLFILVVPDVALINESIELSVINSRKDVRISDKRLLKFYTKDTNIEAESYWKLKSWVPKKYMLQKLNK